MPAVTSSNPLSSAFCIGNPGICLVTRPGPACSRVACRRIACRITVDTEKIACLLNTNTKGTLSETRNPAAHRLRNKAVRNAKLYENKKGRDVLEEDSSAGFKASFEVYIKAMEDVRRNREDKNVEENKQNLTMDDRVNSKENRIMDERINLKANIREEECGNKDFKADLRFANFDKKVEESTYNLTVDYGINSREKRIVDERINLKANLREEVCGNKDFKADLRFTDFDKNVDESKHNLTVDYKINSREKRIVDERMNLKANLREEECGNKDSKADLRFTDFDKKLEERKQNLTVDDRVRSREKRIVDERMNLKANLREEERGNKDFEADLRFSDFNTKPSRPTVNMDRRTKRVAVGVKAIGEKRSAGLKREEINQLRAELMNSKGGDTRWLLDGDMDADVDGGIETQSKAFQFCKDIEFRRPRDLQTKVEGLAQLLNNTDFKMPEWHFSKLMHGAKMKFTDHSILRLVQCLGNMGNWRRALQVVQWLHGRQRYKYCKSRYVYTTVLAILGKANKPVEALNVFHAMREDFSTYPDMPAYHSIAVTLGQAGHVKELLDVMDCLQVGPEKKLENVPLMHWDPCLQPDVVVYNAVINACVQRKDCHGAIWVLQQMRLNGIAPSSATYGLVMEVMLKSGKYDLVHKFYEKMKKSGWIPNMLTYKVLIQAFWQEGKINEIVATIKEMERRGIVGSAGLYYRFACCLCSAGKFQDALLQVEKIRRVANRPLYVTYTGLIKACIESGHLHDGISIFHHMQKFCAPNIVTCNIMMKLYGQNNMFEEAKSLFQEIIKGRIGLQRLSSNDPTLNPDIFTYNAMLEACVAAHEWDYFETVYEKMLRHGYQFDNKRHVWLVVAASKAGKGHLLDRAFEQLVELGKIPHVSLYKEQICQSLQAGEYTEIINYIRGMEDARLNISENGWVELLEKNVDRINQENLQELSHEVNNFVAGNDQGNHILMNLINSLQHMSEHSAQAETTPKLLMEQQQDMT